MLPEGGVKIIDWENFCLGPIADDISYLITDNDLPDELELLVMDTYHTTPHIHHLKELLDLKNSLDNVCWVLKGIEDAAHGEGVATMLPADFYRTKYYPVSLRVLNAKIQQLKAK